MTNPNSYGIIISDSEELVFLCQDMAVLESQNLNRFSTINSRTAFLLGGNMDKMNEKQKDVNNLSYQRNLYSRRRGCAEHRGIEFNLTFEEFMTFWQKPCVYCGKESKIVYIDRTDNSKGYEMDNVKPCCFTCNRRKGGLSEGDFLRENPRIKEGLYWDSGLSKKIRNRAYQKTFYWKNNESKKDFRMKIKREAHNG